MTKARLLANLASNGQLLADGVVQASEVAGLATVATSGSYTDLTNKPTGTGGGGGVTSYNDLTDKPTIPSIAGLATSVELATKADSSSLATVATTGEYADLINKPTIPVVPTLADVATTGNYNDLINQPTITALLPDQTGNNGKYLSTNGSSVLWVTAPSGGGGNGSSSFISNTSNHTLGFIDSDTGSDGTYYPGLKLYNPSSPYNVPIKIISNHPGTPSIMIGNNNEDVVGGGSSIGIGNNVTSASNCIAIGNNSHSGSPGPGSMLSNSIAIGYGTYNNGSNEIAIGSGASTADSYAIAIGANALATTGAIALGPSTTASAAGSIVINTDAYSNLSSSAAGLYINPIRSSFSGQTSFGVLQYDASTKEVFYGSIASSPYTNQYLMVGYTTTAVETELFVGGIPDSRIPTTTGTNTYYTVDVVCTESNDGSNYAAFTLKSVVSNKANVVSDVGNVYEIVVTRSSPNITVDVRADDVNNSINLYVTGLSGVSLQWKAAVTTLEM